MSILAIVLIALGLSMDAFAVAITYGISIQDAGTRNALKIGICFGFFQALMTYLGWILGINLSEYITKIDHWIALILLVTIGGKMIYEALKEKNAEDEESRGNNDKGSLSIMALLTLAIATSIDALAVGISFAFLNESIIKAISIIGLITFGVCFSGVFIGKKGGELLKSHARIFGGIILIAIGVKIFVGHINICSMLPF